MAAFAVQSTAQPVMQDAATHDQLSQTLHKIELKDPMMNLKASTGVDPSVVNRPIDILSQSDIVCFGGYATLVPKRAILQIPKNYENRIHLQPGVKIQSWREFYTANRGWITTVEVSRIQAEGNDAIAEAIQKQMAKSRNLIVATYQGGPISVLPLKLPEDAKPAITPP